jgi:hypothetical protein
MIESGPSRTGTFHVAYASFALASRSNSLLDDPWGDRLVPNSERDGFCERILVRKIQRPVWPPYEHPARYWTISC